MRTTTTPAVFSAAAAAIAAIAVGVTLLVSDRPAPVAPMTVERVQAAAPAPKATPVPAPAVRVAGSDFARPSNECPQMDNPGGRLGWGPTSQQGPSATGGEIKLPTLGVTAPIVKVGIDGANKMVVPHNAIDVAWLDRGGIPGYTNNVVLAGHIAYSRVPGSFEHIGNLRPGDEVRMQMHGEHYVYRVQWVCLFGRNTDRASQIMGYTTQPSLTMISCGGGWDSSAGTHTSRYAVRAVLVSGPGSDGNTQAAAAPAPTPSSSSLLPIRR